MPKSYKRWVEDLVAKTAVEFNLLDWRIDVSFDEPDPDDGDGCTAWTYVDSRYLTSYIHFTPYAKEMWEEGRIGTLAECVVHEVSHILLNPLHEFAKQAASPQTEPILTDILEQTTQRLTRIVIEHLPPKFFSR
jgi:hypothetical protein